MPSRRPKSVRQASGDLFPTDAPLPSSQLIGRRQAVRELAARLEGGINTVMAGPRRTGKTSVCDAALARVRGHGFYVVSVDLFRLADAAEFAEAIARGALENRPAARKIIPAARRLGRHALDAAQGAATIRMKDDLGDAVEIALTPGVAAKDPQRALADALELPQRIALADGKRCIVFFDEFQEVANDRHPYGNPDMVTKRMRAIFQRATEVTFLFAGSLEHIMRDLFGTQSQAFGGFGSFYDLAPIPAEAWAIGLRERLEADDCSIDDAALDRLIELGELHPRVTMLIAQQTHAASIAVGQRHLDLTLVAQGYEQAYHGDRALLDQLVERIRASHRLGLKLARRIAGNQTLTSGLHAGEADRALTKLRQAGLIERVSRGSYLIANPLLRRHLLETQP